MKCWVYILRSRKTDRYYCGHSSDLLRRLKQHNDSDYRLTRTTKILEGHWEIVWTQECPDRSEAMKLEKSIKKRGVARYLEAAQLAESR